MKTIHTLLTFTLLLSLSACQDEEFLSIPDDTTLSRAVSAASAEISALTSTDGGQTWTASRRVPLVGDGRIVDDMSNALVEVLTNNQGISNIPERSGAGNERKRCAGSTNIGTEPAECR